MSKPVTIEVGKRYKFSVYMGVAGNDVDHDLECYIWDVDSRIYIGRTAQNRVTKQEENIIIATVYDICYDEDRVIDINVEDVVYLCTNPYY